jgi:hypothetical protein
MGKGAGEATVHFTRKLVGPEHYTFLLGGQSPCDNLLITYLVLSVETTPCFNWGGRWRCHRAFHAKIGAPQTVCLFYGC